MNKKFLKTALSTRWAIREDEAVDLASSDFGSEGWFKNDGEVNHKNLVTMRDDGIAILHIDGALSYRSDLWAAYFGMDTYNSIEAAFDETIADPRVLGIVLDINSPGGEVSGCADLADKIFNARGSKPFGIVARTGGLMCSAAYWIGSSCEKVYTAANGTLGSIGVLCAYNKTGKDVDVVVSDLSPDKAATPDTEKGLALVKQELNDLASVFIDAVARNRATTADDVIENYGKGGVFIGQKSVDANLADGVVSMDDLIEMMKNPEGFKQTTKGAKMATENNDPKAEETHVPTAEEIAASAIAAYKKNIADVKALFDECGIEEDAVAFVDGGKTFADAREFAFDAMKKNLAALKGELENVKAELASRPSADANLSADQQTAIKKGIEADAAAANGVQGGAGEISEDAERKAIDAAFAKGFHK